MRKLVKQIYDAAPLKKEVFTILKSVWKPGESIYRHLHFTGDFVVPIDPLHSFIIRHFGYEVENTLFWEGLNKGFESVALRVWSELARDATVVFDIGANTGIYSLIAKALNKDSDVYAFEPIRRVYERLLINNTLNSFAIECIDAAASDQNGVAQIYDFPGDHTYSTTFHREIFSGDDLIPVEVKIKRLDTFIVESQVSKIDLIKIDVEGHEPNVLRGLGDYLTKFAPTIFIEILTDGVGAEVENILSSSTSGYKYFYIEEQRSELQECQHLTRRESFNYLVCTPEVMRRLEGKGKVKTVRLDDRTDD